MNLRLEPKPIVFRERPFNWAFVNDDDEYIICDRLRNLKVRRRNNRVPNYFMWRHIELAGYDVEIEDSGH